MLSRRATTARGDARGRGTRARRFGLCERSTPDATVRVPTIGSDARDGARDAEERTLRID